MKLYEAIEWHDKRAHEWEELRLGVGKFTLEKQKICIEELNPKENESILDVGCGSGFFAREAAKRHAKVVALDMSENMLKVAKEFAKRENLNIKFVIGDAKNLHFKDSSFDKLIAVDLIEHLTNPEIFIKEIGRVIKSGGKVVLAWPHSKSLYRVKYYFEKYILQREMPFTTWLSASLVEKWLKNSNFKVKRVSTYLGVTAILVCEKL